MSEIRQVCGVCKHECGYTILHSLGIPSKPKDNAFGDLLGSNFTPKTNSQSRTLRDLKSANAAENALDPDRARVMCAYSYDVSPKAMHL